jgi:hypothetical protein
VGPRRGRVAAVFAVALALCIPRLAFTYDKSGDVFY